MKILIYSPYLKTLGGGERYVFEVAEYFLKKNNETHLAWEEETIKELAKLRFNLDINRIKILPNLYQIINKRKNLFEKYKAISAYDLIFFVSDGSIPFLFGKKNLLHFQVPFKNIKGKNGLNQLKLKFINKVVCNSFFTKKIIDDEFTVNSEVLYPPISMDFKPAKKENIILSVGRFDNLMHTKKQDILLKCFKELINEEKMTNWKLVLVGNVLEKNTFIKYLEESSKNFPVKIISNIDFISLQKLYAKAKIYWHAAGFEEDLKTHPEKAEHFGMSTVEAMSAGCVPVVFNGGGLPEIIQDSKNGFLFNNLSQLKKISLNLAKDENLRKKISREAIKRSKDFSQEIFYKKLNEIIQ